MSFNRLFIFAFCCFLFSCSEPVKEKKTESPAMPVKILASETDTFYTNAGLVSISDTAKAAFDAAFRADADTSEQHYLNASKGLVKRSGDTLIISLTGDGIKKLLSTHYTEGMDSFYEYKYLGFNDAINYHLIYVGEYEAFTYLMINGATGRETNLWGMPAVSPDNKCVAASCFDLQAGFVYNGIQLFEVTPDSLRLRWSRELGKWGADHIAWLDNRHIVAEKMQLDSSQQIHTSYVKVTGPGK